MNWVDFLIILIFGIYVWDGYRRGFLRLAWELVGIIIAFIFALRFYSGLNQILQDSFHISELYTKPIAFLSIWFITQAIFYLIGKLLSYYTPTDLKESKINHYGGIIPASLKGIIFIAILLILFIIMPINSSIKNNINHSLIGGELISQTAKIESEIEQIFAGGTSMGSLTSTQVQEENASLNFSTTNIKIDETAETQMLNMINLEREKVGLKSLQKNILVRNVARAQGRDMLLRGYFSHNSPTGETLMTRLNNAHVNYTSAAENIALAPTVELAQIGLMNSTKHKQNILDPSFTQVGIGVLDAGQYGLMFVQDFIK